MAMSILGWLLTGAIFSFGFIVMKRGKYLTYGDLALAGGLSLLGPIGMLFVIITVYVRFMDRLEQSYFWETPVFKKDK
jgi:hypothetical protein